MSKVPVDAEFFRPISSSERFYIASQGFAPPFAISLVVQGVGRLDEQALDTAVSEVAEGFPGCRLISRGMEWWAVDAPPPVRHRPGSLPSAPESGGPLDPESGPTCEVLLYDDGVVFVAFHGVMDGQGVAAWARAVFAALRGDRWQTATSVVTDSDVICREERNLPPPRKTWPSPLGPLSTSGKAAFLNATIPGHWQGLPGWAMAAAARLLEADQTGLFMVSTDLRRQALEHGFDPHSTANLSRPLPFELTATNGLDPRTLQQQILRALHENRDLARGHEKQAQRLGTGTLRLLVSLLLRQCRRTGKGSNSGIISHLGFIPPEAFSCPGFTATTWRSFGPHFPAAPFTMVLCQSDHHCDIALTCADHPPTLARARRLLDALTPAPLPPRETSPLVSQANSVLATIWNHAGQASDHDAVIDGLQSNRRLWSYGALCVAADKVARGLIAMGVQPGERIALCGRRCAQTIASLLGIMRAGAAWVPIDPDYPPGRITRIMEIAEIQRVLVDETAPAGLPGRVLPIADLLSRDESEGTEALPDIDANSIAYVIFTSGSTGLPKGVQVTHGNLLHYARWAAKLYAVDQDSGFAFLTSQAFDLTITSLFAPLHAGARIIAVPDAMHPTVLRRVLAHPDITCLKLTPTHLNLIDGASSPSGTLRTLVVGGEQLTTSLAWRTQRMLGPQLSIFNEYGPTEATVGCMVHRFDPSREHSGPVSIGVAAPEASLRILEPGTETPVPDGKIGELLVSGPGVAAGYVGLEPVDGEHFVRLRDGARAYRTGDLVRRETDGTLTFVGRQDDQVKVHGVRIDLGDIERNLCELPKVTAAAVRPTPGAEGLCAFVAAAPDTRVDPLRESLRKLLPAAMVPTCWHLLPGLPTSVHGKVDTEALHRCHERAAASDEAEDDRPTDPIDGLWHKHGGTGGLFAGDSLGLLQLAAEAAETCVPRSQHRGFFSALQTAGMSLTLPQLRELVGSHSTPVEIRPARPEDADAVVPLMQESDDAQMLGSTDNEGTSVLRDDFIAGRGWFGHHHTRVAIMEGEIVACLTRHRMARSALLARDTYLALRRTLGPRQGRQSFKHKASLATRATRQLLLVNGFVREDYRGRGIFTALMEDARTQALHQEVQELAVDLPAGDDDTKRFFTRLGFFIQSPASHKTGASDAEVIRMTRKLHAVPPSHDGSGRD